MKEMRVQTATALDETQREKLVLEHLPHVQYIARRIHFRLPPQVLLDDLVHAGVLGLMDAVQKYDPTKNVHLKSYAEFRIRGSILDSLRQQDWSPRALRQQARRMKQAISNCEARLGHDPSEPEIAAELQMSLESLQRLRRDLHGLDIGILPDETAESGAGDESINYSSPAREEDPFCCALRSEMSELLRKTIGELPGRQRDVLTLYHFEELSMKAVGSALGIGESRVSQIHTAALVHLRARLAELLEHKAPPALH